MPSKRSTKDATIYARSYSFPHAEHERLKEEARKLDLPSRSARALQLLRLGREREKGLKQKSPATPESRRASLT